MEAILECCAGLDVHQETIVVCLLSGPLNKKPKKEVRTFSTLTKDILLLGDWLEENHCSHIAMESTGVYWKPIWNILEAYPFESILANACSIKNVSGRKTDVKDAEWIAQLLRCGLIEKSFVPSMEIRDLRDLTRYRKKLIQDMTQEKNRIHKVLQDANIKLTTYMSDIFGVSGRNIIEQLLAGKKITIQQLGQLVKGKLKPKVPLLVDALNSRLRSHHLEMIEFSWEHLKFLEKKVSEIEVKIKEALGNYSEEIALLDSIPGVNDKGAAAILAEIGPDMSVFPTDRHLASWAGLSPGNNESAGKKNELGSLKETSI